MLTTRNSHILVNGKDQETCTVEEILADATEHQQHCHVPTEAGECIVDHLYAALIAARKGETCERSH